MCYIKACSWGGCRVVFKSLRSANSIASTTNNFNYVWKGYRGKAKKGQSLSTRVSGQHGNPAKYTPDINITLRTHGDKRYVLRLTCTLWHVKRVMESINQECGQYYTVMQALPMP